MRVRLIVEPASVGQARRAVEAHLRATGIDDSLLADILIAVHEAASNAVAHAYRDSDIPGEFAVYLDREADELRVTVLDQGCGPLPDPDSAGLGMGIPLMTSVSESLEITRSRNSGPNDLPRALTPPGAEQANSSAQRGCQRPECWLTRQHACSRQTETSGACCRPAVPERRLRQPRWAPPEDRRPDPQVDRGWRRAGRVHGPSASVRRGSRNAVRPPDYVVSRLRHVGSAGSSLRRQRASRGKVPESARRPDEILPYTASAQARLAPRA